MIVVAIVNISVTCSLAYTAVNAPVHLEGMGEVVIATPRELAEASHLSTSPMRDKFVVNQTRVEFK